MRVASDAEQLNRLMREGRSEDAVPGLLLMATSVKVRIRTTPRESEVDGVRLDRLNPGSVHEVSPILGAWLIAERYAEPEMRKTPREYEESFSGVTDKATQVTADDRPHRRSNDR